MGRGTRHDAYKSFKFAIGLVAVGAIAVRLGRKFLAKAEILHPGVYVEETPAGIRPIKGVSRSTAAFVTSRDKSGARSSRQSGRR